MENQSYERLTQHEQVKRLVEYPINHLEKLVKSGININALNLSSFSALAVAINIYFSSKKTLDSVGTYRIADQEIREAKLKLNDSELRIKELLRLGANAGVQDCEASYSPIYQALIRFDSEDGLDNILQSLIKYVLEYDQNIYGSIKIYYSSLKTYYDRSILEAYINNVCKKYWNNEYDILLQQMIAKYCRTSEGCREVIRIFDLMVKESEILIATAIIKSYLRPIEGDCTLILGKSAQELSILKPFLKSKIVQESLEDYRGLKTVQELEHFAEIDSLKLSRLHSILNHNKDIAQVEPTLRNLPDELKLHIVSFFNLNDECYSDSAVSDHNLNNYEADTNVLGENDKLSCMIL